MGGEAHAPQARQPWQRCPCLALPLGHHSHLLNELVSDFQCRAAGAGSWPPTGCWKAREGGTLGLLKVPSLSSLKQPCRPGCFHSGPPEATGVPHDSKGPPPNGALALQAALPAACPQPCSSTCRPISRVLQLPPQVAGLGPPPCPPACSPANV